MHCTFGSNIFIAWMVHKLSTDKFVIDRLTADRLAYTHTDIAMKIPRDKNWHRVKTITRLPNRRMCTRSISNSVWFHQSNTCEYMYTICCKQRMKQINCVPNFHMSDKGWVMLGAGCCKYCNNSMYITYIACIFIAYLPLTHWRIYSSVNLTAWPAPSHYLNQCWYVVNRTLRNKHSRKCIWKRRLWKIGHLSRP